MKQGQEPDETGCKELSGVLLSILHTSHLDHCFPVARVAGKQQQLHMEEWQRKLMQPS